VLQQFLNHIRRFDLGEPPARILLAVSGGLDSMVMLHLYHTAGFEIGVAHCNFQLRGKAADQDTALVKDTCSALSIPFYGNSFDTADYALGKGISIQMAARELRYAWFDSLLAEHQYQYVATAHHLNDSIETVLLNWVHGGSSEAFGGIPVKNKRIIRPLLFASREALTQYALASNVVWREDHSNQSDDYERNYIRHHVIPHLKEMNPSLEQTILRGFEKSGGESALMTIGFENWKAEFVKVSSQRLQISKKAFHQMTYAPSVLWRLLRPYSFSFDTCSDVIASLHGQSGKRFLSSSHQLVVDREDLIVMPQPRDWNETIISDGQQKAILGSWLMSIENTGLRKSGASNEATLDADKVKFPLTWRKWRAGDAFYPLGMGHKKKLSDFLIDNKISVSDKDYVTVLVSAGEIIWVVGYRIDNRFRITEETQSTISFLMSPYFLE
jgi:tRNA(Ile)-lysidine synthase